MLFGARQAYATTEIAHPFYQNYFKEIKRRITISLKAHYARTLPEVLKLLEPEGIDYFIFSKKRFYPEALKKEKYFAPLDTLIKELTSRHYTDYAYKLLPSKVKLDEAPYMLFKDEQSALIDIKKLREFINKQDTSS